MIVIGVDLGVKAGQMAYINQRVTTDLPGRTTSGYLVMLNPIPTFGKPPAYDVGGINLFLNDLRAERDEVHLFVEVSKSPPVPVFGQCPRCKHKFVAGRRTPADPMYSKGRGEALFEGLCCAHGITCHKVHPATWHKALGLRYRKKGEDIKQKSIAAARALFPDVSLKRTTRCRTDSHDIADALNILWYGCQQLGVRI